jgi:hypothetical protein
LLLAGLIVGGPVVAQSAADSRAAEATPSFSPVGALIGQVVWDLDNITGKKRDSTGPAPIEQARPDAWPRLDPGAVLCRSEADLTQLAAFRRGETTTRPACQIIRSPTAIQIVHRVGPGKTEVTVTAQNNLDGWTDAWLPEKAPPTGAKGTSIR